MRCITSHPNELDPVYRFIIKKESEGKSKKAAKIAGLVPIKTWAATSEENSFEQNMEQYFSISDDGLILFDTISAEQNGVNQELINSVANQIDKMNQLVLNGDAYITEDYSVVQYLGFSRARGENKIVTHWWGLTEIYMDSAKAEDLYDDLVTITMSYSDLAYDAFFENIPAGILYNLVNLSYVNYLLQVEQAKAPGRGIIMNIQTDLFFV